MEEHHRGKKDESTPMKRNCKASVYTDLHVSPFIGTYPCTIRTNPAVSFQFSCLSLDNYWGRNLENPVGV